MKNPKERNGYMENLRKKNNMGKSEEYHDFLQRAIDWRVKNESDFAFRM